MTAPGSSAHGGFVGVVCGLKSEAAAVRRAAGDDPRVRIGVSGANADRAEEIAAGFCAAGARGVLSVGVSGGLDPALRPGDLVLGAGVAAPDGAVFESDPALASAGLASAAGPARAGRLFGADDIIDSVAAKAALYADHRALAVDMESHGCARAAARAGVAFLAIRAVADPADRALPPAALGAVASDGSTRVFRTLIAALRDPAQFPALMKLGEDSAAAQRTLTRCLGPMLLRIFTVLSLDRAR